MDYQTQRVGKMVIAAKEDLKSAVKRIESINHETCDDKTLHLIDEAVECISMAQRFLDHVDLSKYTADYNGENIVMKMRNI